MKKLRSFIIDDEIHSIKALKWELDNFLDRIEIIGEANNGKIGLQKIEELKPDLVFLDIQMPGMNGFDVVKQIEDKSIKVIFTTAYDKFALQAFEVSAFDYLVKPVSEDDLRRALDKISVSNNDDLIIQVRSLLSNIQVNNNEKIITIPTSEGVEFIDISTIIRCKAEGNYTHIYLLDEPSIFVSKTLKEIEGIIDNDQFYRVHQSHLINLRMMKKYNRGKAGSILLKDGELIPVSRNKKGGFLKF